MTATADLIDLVPDLPSCETDFKPYGRRLRFQGRIRTVSATATTSPLMKWISVLRPWVQIQKSAKDGAGETDIPVSFGGVEFIVGHYLYSNEDGIVVSPEPLQAA